MFELNLVQSYSIKFRLGLLPTATRVIAAFQRHHVETHCFGIPCRWSGYQPDLYRVFLAFRASVYCCAHETVTLTFNDHSALQTADWNNFVPSSCGLHFRGSLYRRNRIRAGYPLLFGDRFIRIHACWLNTLHMVIQVA
jgi:hypothetical protein